MQEITSIDNGMPIEGVAWSDHDAGNLAVTSGFGSQLKIFSRTGDLLKSLHLTVMFAGNSISFLGGSRYLVTSPDRSNKGENGPALTVWDATSGTVVKEVPGATPDVGRLSHATIFATSPDGANVAYVASPLPGDPIILHETRSWSVIARVPLPGDIAQSLVFVDPRTLLVGTASGRIMSINLDDTAGQPQVFIVAYPRDISLGVVSLSVSPDGRFLASGSGIPFEAYRNDLVAAPVKIWNISDRKMIVSHQGKFWPVQSLSWSRESQHLAATGGDRSIHIFDIDSDIEQKICYEDSTASLKYSSRDDMLAVGHGTTVSIYKSH